MKLSRPWAWLLVVSGAVWLTPIVSAEDWQAVGFVSSTVGVSTSRVCIGAPSANRPSDFGCPTTAPYINPTNGYVGIGTSAPDAPLIVRGPDNGVARWLFKAQNLAANNESGFYQYSNNAVALQLRNGSGSLRVNLQPGGNSYILDNNIGIGTTAPQATLQVSGSFTVSTSAQTTTPSLYVGTNGNVGVGVASPANLFHIRRASAGGIPAGYSSNYDVAVIENSEDNYLHFLQPAGRSGGIIFDSPTVRANGYIGYSNVSNAMTFATNGGIERLRIGNNGNVGIGTIAPSNTLHVAGTARITSWTAIAANVTPTTALDVYGTISATNLLVNGVAIGQADRIVSGTASVVAHANKGVSISVPLEVAGSIKIASTGTEVCDNDTLGLIRFDAATGAVEMCRQ